MRHAEGEMKKLQSAFAQWCDDDPRFPEDIGDKFWPFVAYVLAHPEQSAEKIALLNRFKAALGMKLEAHEKFGVEK